MRKRIGIKKMKNKNLISKKPPNSVETKKKNQFRKSQLCLCFL